jgi:hypothetical protein
VVRAREDMRMLLVAVLLVLLPGCIVDGTWTPAPPSAPTGELAAVTCPAADFCLAANWDPETPLVGGGVEWWDGTAWTTWPTPYDDRIIVDVECASTTSCVIVSYAPVWDDESQEDVLGDTRLSGWHGTGWLDGPVAPDERVLATDCAPDGTCTAVTGSQHLVVWDGTWHDRGLIGGRSHTITALDCVSDGFCMTASNWVRHLPDLLYGTRVVPLPPRWRDGVEATAVACPDESFCLAVGEDELGMGAVLRWDGVEWHDLAGAERDEPSAVSCAKALECLVLSSDDTSQRLSVWDGTDLDDLPPLPDEVHLTDLSCVEPETCMVVGSVRDGGDVVPYAAEYTWDAVDEDWEPGPVPEAPSGGVHLVTPARLLDTRRPGEAPLGTETRRIQVAGRGGVPATGATGLVVTLTVVDPALTTALDLWDAGGAVPDLLNAPRIVVAAGDTRSITTFVPIGEDGGVNLHNRWPGAHVVLDVVGWIDGDRSGDRLVPGPGTRLADTRRGLGGGALGPGEARAFPVAGAGGVPASGATAALVNLTAVGATAPTHLQAWATGSPRPPTSVLNAERPTATAALVVAAVGPDGTITVRNHAGSVHLVVDLVAWLGPRAATGDAGGTIGLLPTARMEQSPRGDVTTEAVDVVPYGLVPQRASAVLLGVVVRAATGPSHRVLHPAAWPVPPTSTANVTRDEVAPTTAVVPVDPFGELVASGPGDASYRPGLIGWVVPDEPAP